jgi:hypothetical protein
MLMVILQENQNEITSVTTLCRLYACRPQISRRKIFAEVLVTAAAA